MTLVDVYAVPDAADHLYRLLKERTPQQAISHRKMPSWQKHCRFVANRPYRAWYLIVTETEEVAGAIYLSKQDEIGIFIFRAFQGNGYGPQAIKALMHKKKRRRYLANVNPGNERSKTMFRNLGFTRLQETYEIH